MEGVGPPHYKFLQPRWTCRSLILVLLCCVLCRIFLLSLVALLCSISHLPYHDEHDIWEARGGSEWAGPEGGGQ